MPKLFSLQLSYPNGKAERLALRFSGPDSSLTLGAASSADLRLSHPGVEPRQCLFRLLDPETLCVENLSDTSPTRLNGRPTEGPEMVGEGDWVEFADLLIEVVAETAANPYSVPDPVEAPKPTPPKPTPPKSATPAPEASAPVASAEPSPVSRPAPPPAPAPAAPPPPVAPPPAPSRGTPPAPTAAPGSPAKPIPAIPPSKPSSSGHSSRAGTKIPIPGGPVPKSAVNRADTPRPAIPRIEIPRSRPLSTTIAPKPPEPPAPPPSRSATPPPEVVEPRPIIPPASDTVEKLVAKVAPTEQPKPQPDPAPEPRAPAQEAAADPEARPPSVPPPASSSRPRQATLRPATRPPSNAPRLAPLSQPAPPPRTDVGSVPSSSPKNPLVSRGMSQLRAELPQQTAPYTDDHLRQVVERARHNASTLGFTAEDQILSFLKCVILVGDDLGSSESKVPDVYFSLNLPGKAPLVRIERALKIAQRVNARGGVGLVPVPGFDSPDERPTSEIRVQPPGSIQPQPAPQPRVPTIAHGVSEEILPSERRGPSLQPTQPGHRERDVTDPVAPSPSAFASAPDHPPPDSNKLPEIEGFKVLEKIGSGGMGTVYRAYHHRLEVEVAIKVFKTLHPEAKTLLSREARAAARLQHPNIVQVLDYQEFGRGAYFAMQLVKGEDAHELIQRVSGRLVHEAEADGVVRALGLTNDQLSPEARSILQGKLPWHRLVAWWMAGIADGLDRAHREGIVHRDIKPSNLLLARDGRMAITDFGLALRREDHAVGANTARAGTPRYLAPERIADWASGADLSGTDGRIDVWAVGATMYELLTYRPAYDGAREAVMRDIVTHDPLPPSQVIWAVPQELDRICLQAMKRNPEERFQQAGEMASALRSWLMGEGPANKGQAQQGGIAGWFKKGT